jgi:hypothetical protein
VNTTAATLARIKYWRTFELPPEQLVASLRMRLNWSLETSQEVLDILEYVRLEQVVERVADMEKYLGRPAVPGDGCFSVGR